MLESEMEIPPPRPPPHPDTPELSDYGDMNTEYVPEAESDVSSSYGSWYEVGTPLPSPPNSPLAMSDNELSEDEDGYISMTAQDHREYDRWYAEDCPQEYDELGRLFI